MKSMGYPIFRWIAVKEWEGTRTVSPAICLPGEAHYFHIQWINNYTDMYFIFVYDVICKYRNNLCIPCNWALCVSRTCPTTWFVTVSNLNSLHDKLILGNFKIHWCFVSFLNNESNFTSAQAITILYIEFENYEFKITVTSSQWVKVVEAAQILPYGRQEPTCLTLSAS